mgnify:CR=1 FL=1
MSKGKAVWMAVDVMCVVLAISCFIGAKRVDNLQKRQYSDTNRAYLKLFSSGNKDVPRENLTVKEINTVEE